MYYAPLLRLCGWEESEIQQEKPRIEEAFRKLGIGPEDMKHAEVRVKEGYDIELMGVRKALSIWLKALIDLVLAKEERKRIIYYSFPSIGGLGFTTSMLGGEEILCVVPEMTLQITMGSIFGNIEPILIAAEENALLPGTAMCGLSQTRFGAMVKGIIPLPDAFLSSSFLCDQASKADEWLHEVYGVPMILTDNVMDSAWGEFPHWAAERVFYLGTELNQTFDQVLELIEKKPTAEEYALFDAEQAKFLAGLRKITEFMKSDPIPIGQGNVQLIRLARNGLSHRLFPQMGQAIEILVPELEKRVEQGKGPVPKGAPRVAGFLYPVQDQSLIRLIERAGIAIPITYLTYDETFTPQPSTYTTIGERRAEAELRRGMFHSLFGLLYWIKEICKSWDVDGLLWPQPYSCRPLAMTGFIYKSALEEELAIPVLNLELDWFDNRTYSAEAFRTRIETFAQLLAARKASRAK